MLSEYVNRKRPEMVSPVVVTADLGFAKKGRNFAATLNASMAFIEKRRRGNDATSQALTLIGNVRGRDVIIVDDEVDTAGTVTEAVHLIEAHGARQIYLVFVHAVLSDPAVERLACLPLTEMITTDSIPIPPEKRARLGERLTVLSVAPLLAEVILRAHEGRSVGELFHE
jgi:ribose-phosphate pyrophosphokinase